jgi:hypothetical protein
MTVSGLLLLFLAMLAASRPSIGLVAAIGVLLPFEANSLLTTGVNLITVDFYLLMIVAYCVTRFLATGRIRLDRLNMLIIAICVVGVAVSMFAPRFFAGQVGVIPLDHFGAGYALWLRVTTVPLQPTFNNVTQSIYLVLQFMGLACLCGLAARAGYERLSAALKLAAGVNIALVAATQIFGPQILDFFFTAGYRDLRAAQAFGDYRAVGAFREAARQGQFAAMCFGYFMTAYVIQRGRLNAWLAIGSLVCAVLSYSSTALLGLLVSIVAMIWMIVVVSVRGAVSRGMWVRVGTVTTSSLVAAVLLLVAGGGAVEGFLADLFTGLTVEKLASSSGFERLAFVNVSLDVLAQTYGIGCGLGCTRGNGLWLVMAANGGILLALLLLLIVLGVIYPRRQGGGTLTQAERFASYPAVIGFLALLASLSGSLTVPNVGIVFTFAAALCWTKRAGLPDAAELLRTRRAAADREAGRTPGPAAGPQAGGVIRPA